MNFIRERVLKGEFVAGAWCNLASSLTTEMAGDLGFDWVLVDQEHGPGDNMTLLGQLQSLSGSKAAALVRMPWVDRILFKKALDLGASGLMVPYIQTAEEAKEAVSLAKYVPKGERGVASSPRCTRYSADFPGYFAGANANLLTITQIETVKSVDNAEAIAAVDGVDVLFVGPLDLSISSNYRDWFENDKYLALLKRVAVAAKNQGKAAGILLPHVKWIPVLRELGYTFVACGADGGYVLNGLKTSLEALRA
ncbi:HpcH/HpaI aldolase/citrate lyase family protein [uncultured Alphaproteobacteria bacterium]|uniref:HpcH/HpaI aldolase/citrate lyase family protein n=1 Tax=uncultured Alphaproteobacteria bacterium TaxID=91750 RepID=A0A212KMJ9_9PROT|nr:HpcH/HpaI aldolase/citrate lyase family protein [uncultured Alphaproteobacteria bacterium]